MKIKIYSFRILFLFIYSIFAMNKLYFMIFLGICILGICMCEDELEIRDENDVEEEVDKSANNNDIHVERVY